MGAQITRMKTTYIYTLASRRDRARDGNAGPRANCIRTYGSVRQYWDCGIVNTCRNEIHEMTLPRNCLFAELCDRNNRRGGGGGGERDRNHFHQQRHHAGDGKFV